MTADHPAIFTGDWWRGDLGETSEIVSSPSGLTRRSSFRDADFIIDNDDVLGVAMTLGESYKSSCDIDGRRVNSTSQVGAFAVLGPGQVSKVRLDGDGRFLLLGLSVPHLIDTIGRDLEIDVARIAFETRLAQRDPVLERALLHVATVGEDCAYEAVLTAASRLVLQHSSLAKRTGVSRNVSLTPIRLRRVVDRVEQELARPLSLFDLANTAGVSAYHFAREFKAATGLAPHQYLVRRRVDRAIQLLATTRLSIEQISRRVGFHRGSHLSRHMHQTLGLTPGQLRKVL